MKILANRSELLTAFNLVSGVAPVRSPKPILQSLKLVADAEGGSTLMATDLEVGVRYRVLGVKVDQPGPVILPTQRVQSILRTTPDDELAIEAGPDAVTIRGLHAQFKLPVEDPDLFPDPPDFAASAYHVLSSADLRRLIRRTIFATDVESTRYALGGVLFEMGDDRVTVVGTDGRRLARASAPVEIEGGATKPSGQPVVPVKALKLLEKQLYDDGPPVHLTFGPEAVHVRTDRASIWSRLVSGRFPKYQEVFPGERNARATVDAGALLAAVGQAAITTSDESRGIDFAFADGLLSLSSQSPDVGRSEVEAAIAYEGPPITLTMDPKYLTDVLKVLEPSAPVSIDMVDHKQGVVIAADDYANVIMPLTRGT